MQRAHTHTHIHTHTHTQMPKVTTWRRGCNVAAFRQAFVASESGDVLWDILFGFDGHNNGGFTMSEALVGLCN